MTTRDTMKTEIAADLRRGTSDGARVLSAISAAIKFYQPRRFYFNESRSVTFSTVASTGIYSFATIGTQFYRIDGAFITNGDEITELSVGNYLAYETLLDSEEGLPTDYAYIDKSLRLWRTPDAIYSVRLTGHVKLAEPATDDEADNAWFVEAYELIKCRAKASLYAHVWPDPAMAATMQEAERQARMSLNDATHDRVTSGYLTATDF